MDRHERSFQRVSAGRTNTGGPDPQASLCSNGATPSPPQSAENDEGPQVHQALEKEASIAGNTRRQTEELRLGSAALGNIVSPVWNVGACALTCHDLQNRASAGFNYRNYIALGKKIHGDRVKAQLVI